MPVHNPPIDVVIKEIPTGDIDGINKVFNTTLSFVTGSTQLFLNGQLLSEGAGNDYTESADKEMTLVDAPKGNPGNPDKLFVVFTEN